MANQSSMIMAMMRFHDSSMNIHDKKLHVLLTKEISSKSVIIYAIQQKHIRRVRMELISFTKVFSAQLWENDKL